MSLLIKSEDPEESEIALNLCAFFLHHDPKINLTDLIGMDVTSRDLLHRNATSKVWLALNQMDNFQKKGNRELKQEMMNEIQKLVGLKPATEEVKDVKIQLDIMKG